MAATERAGYCSLPLGRRIVIAIYHLQPTRVEACFASLNCRQDKLSRYSIYHLNHRETKAPHDQHGRNSSLYLACFDTNNTYAFVFSSGLGVEQQCMFLQQPFPEHGVCVGGRGLSFDHEESYSIVSCSQVVVPYYFPSVFFFLRLSHLCLTLYILFDKQETLLCKIDSAAFAICAFLLCALVYISFSMLWLNHVGPIVFYSQQHKLCMHRANHPSCSDFRRKIQGLRETIACMHSIVSSLLGLALWGFCAGIDTLCMQHKARLSYFYLCGRNQESQGSSLDIWSIFLGGDCSHGQAVVRYPQCISLSDVLTSPDVSSIDGLNINTALWGQTIFNSSNYIIN